MKHIAIILCALLCSCQLVQRPTEMKSRAIPSDPLQKSAYYLESNQAQQALQELEPLLVNNENPEVYYLTARSYAAIGALDNAIVYYEKCLQLQSDYHAAYNLLKEIHRYRQITLQQIIDDLKEQQVQFSNSGRGDINAIMHSLNQAYNQQTQIYLAQGKAFLLYSNAQSNIADFSELEAQLRDVQDFIRERKQGYVSSVKKQSFTDPLYLKVLNMRSDVTKKHIQNLVKQSRLELQENNIAKAIDLLREANTQTSRFYEDKDSNIQSLVKDDQIENLSREIGEQLVNTYKKSIDIYVENRKKYEELQQWQDVVDQNRKIEENMENLIQTKVVLLMRFEKVSPEQVQSHPSLIPLYQKLLTALPNSDKKGEYHLQLARCFAAQKQYEQALKHAAIAKKDLGSYRVDDFIEWVVGEIKRSGKQQEMTITLKAKDLSTEEVVRVARHNEELQVASDCWQRIKRCRDMLEEKINAKEIMYGVNTGIGEFSEIVLDDEQIKQFQKYLIYNHSAGIGEPFPIDFVRAAITTRINVHAHGHSGGRPQITETLIAFLNKGVTPVVCEKGSVAACGDLAPMSQVAMLLMGEGEAFYEGQRLPAKEAMEKAGIPIPGLQARDGLSTINGSNFVAGISCLLLHDIEQLMKHVDIAATMSLEALMANMKPYDNRLHELRGFSGAVTCAENLRQVMAGSELLSGKHKTRVQDAYSMRSTPQVVGAARDAIRYLHSQVSIEINGVGDNPIFLPESDTVLTGANFQGTPIALPLDMVAVAVNMVCVMAERRMNRLLNPALSSGLPAFLTKGAGMFSGMMLSQYTSDMLIVEQRILSHPASNQSIPAAADQEDFVSMGMNGILKMRQILDNAYAIIGLELMAAAQALDFRDFKSGVGTSAAHSTIREVVDHLDVDRPLYPDHNNMKSLVQSNKIIEAVEKATGKSLRGSFSV